MENKKVIATEELGSVFADLCTFSGDLSAHLFVVKALLDSLRNEAAELEKLLEDETEDLTTCGITDIANALDTVYFDLKADTKRVHGVGDELFELMEAADGFTES